MPFGLNTSTRMIVVRVRQFLGPICQFVWLSVQTTSIELEQTRGTHLGGERVFGFSVQFNSRYH